MKPMDKNKQCPGCGCDKVIEEFDTFECITCGFIWF